MPYSTKHIRTKLYKKIPLDSSFDAFCIDNFPEVYRLFSSSMNREEKTNLLLIVMAEQLDRIIILLNREQSIPERDFRNIWIISGIVTILLSSLSAIFILSKAAKSSDVNLAPRLVRNSQENSCSQISTTQRFLAGAIYDYTGHPIEGAELLLFGTSCTTLTDTSGAFSFDKCPAEQVAALQRPRVNIYIKHKPPIKEISLNLLPNRTVIKIDQDRLGRLDNTLSISDILDIPQTYVQTLLPCSSARAGSDSDSIRDLGSIRTKILYGESSMAARRQPLDGHLLLVVTVSERREDLSAYSTIASMWKGPIKHLKRARREDFITALREGPAIVHIEANIASGFIAFEDGRISAIQLRDLFAAHSHDVGLVVLATCDSFQVGKALEKSGIHASLVATTWLEVGLARNFYSRFYSLLAKGDSLRTAFNQSLVETEATHPYTYVINKRIPIRDVFELSIYDNIALE